MEITITETDKDFIYFTSTTKDAIRLGASFVQGRGSWRVPINLHTATELFNATKDEKMRNLMLTLRSYYEQMESIKGQLDANGDERLRPYQRVDINFINSRQNVGVFNEQRTGKTPTILLAVKERLGKNIIVCPSGLKLNWEREYKKWLGKDDLMVVSGTPAQRDKIYFNFHTYKNATIVISYETLRVDLQKVLRKGVVFDILIIDEAHRLRNYQTKQSKVLLELSKHCKNVYALTGTPAVNHASDVFGILKLMKPTKYTSFWAFADRYFGSYETAYGRELAALRKDRKDEFQSVLNLVSTQRKRRDIMKWLPKINEKTIKLELTATQKKMINEIVELQRINGEVIPNAVAQLMRLRQSTLDPMLLSVKDNSPKEDFIYEYLEDNSNEKVIIFSMFTSFLNKVKEKLGDKAVMLTGEQSQLQKQMAVDSIQKGTKNVLLANIIAGGVGWTLDGADTIIFTDLSYNPIDNAQAKDRFVPTDPNVVYGGKEIIYLQMDKSIDENIVDLLEKKISIIQYVNDYGIKSMVKNQTTDNINGRKE
jgi:SWI/SNF-related matrix-associated actin-dependent regulator of chromatin subfamily A-like protein 1